ncbi:ABC transporter ATP-binding protein [Glaciibacter sp. 2TAF33]|uniref:ABC transporter ATP-binding protein n=1 Tax=Glaciibacter sp. 2TAF33 TaxID=3233015 RepID=UPI003F90534F
MKITIENLQLRYGKFTAIDNMQLEIGDHESVVLLGKSGCGKTSTMRCIAGLEEPTAGRITVGDTVVFDAEVGINIPPHKRNIGMVFQSYAVWPHMTVFDNVAYSLKLQKVSKSEIKERVFETLELVGLEAFAGRGASLLSGGQMQRVALARSLVMRPSVLLLDEPLSNLDARLRDRLRIELREIQLRLGLTTVYVTHDQQEAFALADRIALMQDGIIVQMDSPSGMYTQPASSSIAHFLGVSNVHPVTSNPNGLYTFGGGVTTLSTSNQRPAADAAELHSCIRSEDIKLDRAGIPGVNSWQGIVRVASFQGSSIRYAVEIADGTFDVVTPLASAERFAVGEMVWVTVDPSAVQVLPQHAIGTRVAAGAIAESRATAEVVPA